MKKNSKLILFIFFSVIPGSKNKIIPLLAHSQKVGLYFWVYSRTGIKPMSENECRGEVTLIFLLHNSSDMSIDVWFRSGPDILYARKRSSNPNDIKVSPRVLLVQSHKHF